MTHSNDNTSPFMPPEFVPGLISVVIPTHNRAEMVGDAILSVINQTYENTEIIIVNDGSTDDTTERVAAYIEQSGSERIRYAEQRASGAPVARNLGLRLSHGEFIQFLDSDDVLHREKLEKQVAFLNANEEIQMTYCATELFRVKPGDLKATRWTHAPQPDLAAFIRWPCWDTNAPLWRRKAIARVGPWREDLAAWQDWEYHIRAITLGLNATGTPDVWSHIREHEADRIDTPAPTLDKLESFYRATDLVSRYLDSLGLQRGAAREALARRARGIATLCFERHARGIARKALRLAIAQRPGPVRQVYARLLLILSYLPLGELLARTMQRFAPVMGAAARALRLLPPREAETIGQTQEDNSLRFLPRHKQ